MADYIQNNQLDVAGLIASGDLNVSLSGQEISTIAISQALLATASVIITDDGHLQLTLNDGTILTLEGFTQMADAGLNVEIDALPDPLPAEAFQERFAEVQNIEPAAGDDSDIAPNNRAPEDTGNGGDAGQTNVINQADVIDALDTPLPAAGLGDPDEGSNNPFAGNTAPEFVFANTISGGLSLNIGERTGEVATLQEFGQPADALTLEMAFTSDVLPESMGGNGTVLASYAVPGTHNEFLVFAQSNGQLAVFVNGKRTQLDVDSNALFDGQPHHLAITLDSDTGAIEAYVDGTLAGTGATTAGQPVQPGGTLTLGQEQDSVGGSFDPQQEFAGEIHNLQVFNAVRDGDDIAESASNLTVDASAPNLIAGFSFTGDTPLENVVGSETIALTGATITSQTIGEDSPLVATLQEPLAGSGLVVNEGADTGEGALIPDVDLPTDALTAEVSFSSTNPPAPGETNGVSLLSYAVPGSHNEFLVFAQSNGKLGVYVNGQRTELDMDANALFDGNEQHLAVTVDTVTGNIEAYVNGTLAATGSTTAGQPLEAGGTISLGQEQDSVGGGFVASQELDGTYYGVKVSEGVLSASEISDSAGGSPSADNPVILSYDFTGSNPENDTSGNTELSLVGGAGIQSGIENGAFVADFDATDADGDPLAYAITDGNDDGAFAMDPATGIVTVADASVLDPAVTPEYILDVQVTDGRGGVDTAQLIIRLNGAPVTAAPAFNTDEDNTLSDTLVATDPNTDQTLTFALVNGPDEGAVTINEDGSFTFNPNTDFQDLAAGESRDVSFEYEVRDGAGGVTIQTATVTVDGVNDAPTDIGPEPMSVDENAPGGTVVASLTAADVDATDTHTFSLVQPTENMPLHEAFMQDTGATMQLNYSGGGGVNLTSMGTLQDDGGNALHSVWRLRNPSETEIEIQLQPVGGATTTYTVSANSDLLVVSDGQLGTHKLLDSDGNQLKVKAANPAEFTSGINVPVPTESLFEIENGQLVVREGAELDYEAQTSHDVTITVTDNHGASYTETITVNVNDLNENPVLSVDQSTTGSTETQLGNTAVFASGESNGRIGDFITATGIHHDGTEAALRTNGGNGLGLSGGRIDRQINYDPATGTSQKVVLDMDAPVTNITLTVDRLIENEFPNGEQGKWTALDINGNEIASGIMSPDTADVRHSRSSFSFELDTGNQAVSSLVVEAIDVTGLTSGDNSDFTIKSITYDKLPPAFEANEGLVSALPETVLAGDVLADFSATDPDTGDVLSFAITAGNDDSAFAIDATTGVLTVNDPTSLNSAPDGFARVVTVEVSDGNGGTDSRDIFITRGQGGHDDFTGTSGDDVILGGLGDDILDGAGGADALYGGAGDDALVFDTLDSVIDGGSGDDTLNLTDGTDLDLVGNSNITGIETLNIANGEENNITLTAEDVFNMSDSGTVTINGDAGLDGVTVSGFEAPTNTMVEGVMYQQFQNTEGDTTLLINLGVTVTPDVIT